MLATKRTAVGRGETSLLSDSGSEFRLAGTSRKKNDDNRWHAHKERKKNEIKSSSKALLQF